MQPLRPLTLKKEWKRDSGQLFQNYLFNTAIHLQLIMATKRNEVLGLLRPYMQPKLMLDELK